jgi:inhibitor of KinA
MTFERLGDSAVLIRAVDTTWSSAQLASWVNALLLDPMPGVVDAVAAYDSLAVYYDAAAIAQAHPDAFDEVCRWISQRVATASVATATPREITIPVCYGGEFGPDLQFVAERVGLSVGEVIGLHSSAVYNVSAIGFAPGFPYLSGLPARLFVPRKSTPRSAVAAGTVAIAGTQAGIYPLNTPGGWQLIGRTPFRLFDAAVQPPSRLQVGDRVRFHPVDRDEFELTPAALVNTTTDSR